MAKKAKTKAAHNGGRKGARSATGGQRTKGPADDAFELLEHEHRQVEGMLDEFDELSDKGRRKGKLAPKICMALEIHAQIAEEIFYPRARDAMKDDDLINEAIVEHATVKNLIGEIEEMEVGEELRDGPQNSDS